MKESFCSSSNHSNHPSREVENLLAGEEIREIREQSLIIHDHVHHENQHSLQQQRNMLSTQVCSGCGLKISDQYVLKVAPDMVWHANCLKCCECYSVLDENCTCFVKEGRTYCKQDYAKLFGVKCSCCSAGFLTSDLVMKARSSIFHLDCFRCTACNRKLVAGDEYSMNDQNAILCRDDHQLLQLTSGFSSKNSPGDCDAEFSDKLNNNIEDKLTNSDSISSREDVSDDSLPRGLTSSYPHLHVTSAPQPLSSSSSSLVLYPLQAHNNNNNNVIGSANCNGRYRSGSGIGGGGLGGKNHHHHKDHHHHHHHHHKTTRIRTVLNEKQLHTLRTCYSVNSRPDALMKEQLVEMTGLSPRVIRVWFQNKRCKDKKRSIVLKQLQQQNQNKAEKGFSDDSWFSHKAIPLIATSPILHEPQTDVQATNIEIEKCPTPFWLDIRQSEASTTPCSEDITQFSVQSNRMQYRHPMTSLTETTNQDDDTVVSFDDVSESLFTPSSDQH